MKKIFSLLVIVAFLFTNIGSVLAGDDQIEAANYLASKDIIKDYSSDPSKYRLFENITRKEVMKIVIKLSDKTIQEGCNKLFVDVSDDWGCKYIETALNAGFIVANKRFRPNDNITKTEAVKLIFKARGIQKTFNTGKWEQDYMETAFAKGLIDEKYYDYSKAANRGWIFSLAKNAFNQTKSFEVVIPAKSPYTTFDNLVTIEGMAPIGEVSKILINGFELKEYDNTQSYWKYHANTKYGNMVEGKNTYKIDFYSNSGVLIISKEVVIIKKSVKLNTAKYSDEVEVK